MPRFSIVVPAYNAEETLAETLDAVCAQTYEDWECTVVDDGSTDATRALAEGYAFRDRRFRVTSQANHGTAAAYNTGVRGTHGEFITVCSADDLLLPEHLECMSRFVNEHLEYDIYSSNGFLQSPGGSRRIRYEGADWDGPRSLELREVIAGCFFGVGAVYRRAVFESADGYRPGIYGEDYDFWLRSMALGARHLYSPSATVVHRLSPDQKSAALVKVIESDIAVLEYLLHNFVLSADDTRALREAIDDRNRRLRDAHLHGSMQDDAIRVDVFVRRTLGARLGGAVMRGLGWAARLVRPLRKARARRQARAKR